MSDPRRPAPPPMPPTGARPAPGGPPVVPYAAPGKAMTGQEQYNLVTDTVAGPNLRLRDNLIQAAAVLVGVAIGVPVGIALSSPGNGNVGAAVGGVIGLIAGLVLSGFALMVFRLVQHARGQHR